MLTSILCMAVLASEPQIGVSIGGRAFNYAIPVIGSVDVVVANRRLIASARIGTLVDGGMRCSADTCAAMLATGIALSSAVAAGVRLNSDVALLASVERFDALPGASRRHAWLAGGLLEVTATPWFVQLGVLAELTPNNGQNGLVLVHALRSFTPLLNAGYRFAL